MAASRDRDDMAREALERSISHTRMAASFAQQIEDQRAESDALRSSFLRLQGKLAEIRARCELLVAEHRRARVVGRARGAQAANTDRSAASLARYEAQIAAEGAANSAAAQMSVETESLEERFAMLERDQQVETMLLELKAQKALTA